MTLADQKATIARTSEAFVNANPSAETVTRAAREVLNDSAERGGGVQMLNVDKIYPGATNKALDNFNLEINPGEMVVLLGGSGCGKSTALRSLAGLEDIQAGRILVGGQDVTGVPVNKRNMAMVFQAYSLFPHMTALQNVEFGLEIRGMGKTERRKQAMEKLELVGLADQAGKYTQQMSGGQQQRVALARALAVNPRVLLLDEPLSALDAKVRVQLRDEIRRIQLEAAAGTALRSLAGLEDIQAGRILVGGQDVTGVPVNKRNMAMVFQAYSLFPHMTALQNVEFGLEIRGMGKTERRKQAMEKLELVGLADQAGKYTQQMSGGQQQRVALARALAVNPRVLLLDEPLSALDAKVRVQLRDEIRRIQLEAGTTTVFVTHDQEEALTVADRIGVMNHGCIEQIADPQTLYRRPGSEYVATFIGLTNRLPGITNGEEAVVFGQRVPLLEASKRDASTVLVRPENLVITLAANDGNMVGEHGRVDMVHFLGALARVDLTVAAGVGHLPVTVQLPANELPAGLTVGSEVVVAPRPIAALAV